MQREPKEIYIHPVIGTPSCYDVIVVSGLYKKVINKAVLERIQIIKIDAHRCPTQLRARPVLRSSLHPQVFRGLPAFALDDIEFDLRAFDEGAITGLLYFLNVN